MTSARKHPAKRWPLNLDPCGEAAFSVTHRNLTLPRHTAIGITRRGYGCSQARSRREGHVPSRSAV